MWVTPVCLPSPECPVAPDMSGTHTQRLSHCLQWTKGGLVPLPCRRPENTEDTTGGTAWLSNLPKIPVSEWWSTYKPALSTPIDKTVCPAAVLLAGNEVTVFVRKIQVRFIFLSFFLSPQSSLFKTISHNYLH